LLLFFDVIREVRSALLESHFSTPIRSVPKVPVPALETAAMEAVNSKLAAITSGRYSLEIVDQSVEDLYRIEYLLRDHFTGILSSFSNVGQGLTQVLDVLFSLESQASLVSLEQPDLHLHPLAVGALTSLIVEDIAVRLGERQVLIETHSETILTRLQKEKRLSSEHPGLGASDFDLRILYCEPVQGELVDDELVQFIAGIHAPDYLLDKLNTLVEDLADQRDQPLDLALLRKDPFIWDKLRDQEDFWEKLSPYMGFNSIEELRLDHLGDVLDPFPISFSDLRIQDLLQ